MLASKEGKDLTAAISGPVGLFGIGIVVIGIAFAYGAYLQEGAEPPDETPLFGAFIVDMINEIMYYAYLIAILVIVAGGLMTGLTLRLRIYHVDIPKA